MDGVCAFFEQVGVRGAIAVTVREAEPRIYAPGELYTFDAALGAGSGSARLGARLPPRMVAGHWRHQRDGPNRTPRLKYAKQRISMAEATGYFEFLLEVLTNAQRGPASA